MSEPKSELPPQAWISVGLDIAVPDAVDLQSYVDVDQLPVDQPYRLVLHGKKASLDEFLNSISFQCDADVYLPAGEITDSQLYRIAAAGADDGRPWSSSLSRTAILPAGRCRFQKAPALKALLFPDLEFQVPRRADSRPGSEHMALPSTPLKETGRRADKWREKMSVEQTEIDALATLRSHTLGQIVLEVIEPFYDPTLERRTWEAKDERERCAQAR